MTPEIYIALLIVLSLASAVLVRIQARAAYALGYAEGRRDTWSEAAFELAKPRADERGLKLVGALGADTLNKQLKRELGLTRKGQ